jgi:hypothetical protein
VSIDLIPAHAPRRVFLGKPDAGNPHVRFDEGSGATRLRSYSTAFVVKEFLTTKSQSHKGIKGLKNQHRVAVAVEPIALLDRGLVSPFREVEAREGAHEYEQS